VQVDAISCESRKRALTGCGLIISGAKMAYLDDWKKLKADFAVENAAVKKKIEKTKADFKKEKKKGDPDLDVVEECEAALSLFVKINKSKTGLTQILPVLDAILTKMEAMVAKKVDPADKKSWSLQVKALGEQNKKLAGALKVVKSTFGKYEKRGGQLAKSTAKAEKILGKPEMKFLTGKTFAARVLIDGVDRILAHKGKRSEAIEAYLTPAMDNW
jgi:hypothetical protein